MLNKLDLELGSFGDVGEATIRKNSVREGIAAPASIFLNKNSENTQKEGGIMIDQRRPFPARNNTPMQEVYRQNTNNTQKPIQPIRLQYYDSTPNESEPEAVIKKRDVKKEKQTSKSGGEDEINLSKGNKLRKNVKKQGLKQYKEDRINKHIEITKEMQNTKQGHKDVTKNSTGQLMLEEKLQVSQSMPLETVPQQQKLVQPTFTSKIKSYMLGFDTEKDKPDSGSQRSSSDQEKVYEKTKEYFRKQEQLELNRLRKARWWVLIVLSYWIVRYFLIQRPKYAKYDKWTKFNVWAQGIITLFIAGALIYSKFQTLISIKYLLYIQAIQMSLANFNTYDEEDTKNFQGLNTLSTVFSVLFAVFNSYLASMIFDHQVMKLCMTFVVFGFVTFSIITTTFIFDDLTYHTTVSLVMSIVYTCLMVPAFGIISAGIQNELSEEIRMSYYERDGFRRMFDALQEGIIVFQSDEILFMNELSNKVFSHLAGVKNFFKHKYGNSELKQEKQYVANIDLKMIYLFQNSKDETTQKGKKKKRITSSDQNSEKSADLKTEFSLKDIQDMPVSELNQKVFTFEKKLSNNDITKMVGGSKDIDKVIRGLQSMINIEDQYIPKFKFFQIKKSLIKTQQSEDMKLMICFIDISQKILYDSSRAEGELLSLINSTISHEMRNPLNSIINQCKIIQVISQQFDHILQHFSHLVDAQILTQLKHIYEQMVKGNLIQTSSSNLLLLNVEDILGYAQLKAGKFTKIVKRFNIKRAIEDITSIQMYQAESKNIKLSCNFIGFPAREKFADKYEPFSKSIPVEHQNLIIDSDEKRIKQVLINLQSNALKFTKENGSITITCEYVRGKYPNEKLVKRIKSRDSYESHQTSGESHNSDESRFERDHRFEDIYAPATGRDKIVIKVVDTGIGIKRKDRLKLFKLFGTLQNTRQMNTQGIGLGLVISENIVKAFQGTIGVKSKYNYGTKFAFSIIIGKDGDHIDSQNDNAIQPPSQRSLQQVSSYSGAVDKDQSSRSKEIMQSVASSMVLDQMMKKHPEQPLALAQPLDKSVFPPIMKTTRVMNVGKILVVDDEKFNCDIIEGFLMILGYQGGANGIVFAYNGEQAVKAVKTAIDECDPYRFSLILMDCNMPFLDGYDATKHIRRAFSDIEIPRDQQPRIVAITGHVENEYVEKALKSGMDKIYPKPLPVKEFGQLLITMKFIEEVPKHLELDCAED